MARNLVGLALSCIVVVSLCGCSSLRGQKKAAVNAPIILEEDVPDKPAAESVVPQAIQNPPGAETVPAGVGSQPATQTDPGNRPPRRRFKFGDKKGWESVPDRSDGKQP
jgi:hypothetical protein